MKIIFTTIIFIVVLSIVMGIYLFIKTIKDHFDRIRRQKSKPPEEFIEEPHEPTRWEKNAIYIINELILLEDLDNRKEHLLVLKRKVKGNEIKEKDLEKLYKKLLQVYNNIIK